MGGEPLLHPECKEFFKITRKYFPQSAIWLVTNGILLPKQKADFWEYAKEYKIEIRPTKYPIKVDWESVEAMCQKYEVPLIFFNNAEVEKTSLQFLLDKEGKQNAFNMFIHCGQANWCVQLRKGRLYTCNIAANAWIFNKKFTQTLEESQNDYVDIHKATSFAEISNFLARPIPFCKYCKVYEWKSIGKWKTSSKTLEEYTQKYEE